MGASESTRKLTVVNDETTGVIRISDSVAKKLKGEVERPKREEVPQPRVEPKPAPLPLRDQNALFSGALETLTLRQQHEEEIQRLEEIWRKQIQVYENQNKQLWKSTTTRLATDLTAIEAKLRKHRYGEVCSEAERKLEDCYQANLSMPLKCSQQVKEFVNCVDSAKRKVLTPKG